MDHLRIGRSLRALRQRRGLTQAQLAEAAGVSQSLVSLIERGHLEAVALRTIQRVFAVLETRLDVQVNWRGGGLDPDPACLQQFHFVVRPRHRPRPFQPGLALRGAVRIQRAVAAGDGRHA